MQEKRGLLAAKDDIIRLLKQASCFGNHDATFMLSVILNYGLDIKSNEEQVVLTVISIRSGSACGAFLFRICYNR